VDVALYEPMLRMLDELLPAYAGDGHVRERIGSGTEYVVPHNHYRTRDGRWLAIACTNDRMFERLVSGAMKRPELLVDFASVADRLRRRDEVDRLVQDWVGAHDAADALDRLERAEVPSSPVNSVRDLFADPQVAARDNILSATSPLGTLIRMAGIVPKLSLTPGGVDALGPLEPGAHNDEIYGGRLGLGRDALAGLRARGVI
jgi:crotonobetainyl-CoA:carnitine CoA-transferase CaiB-like acyl-CoA transferase